MIWGEITFIECYAFVYIIAFNSYNNPRRCILSSLFYRWRDGGSEGLLKFTWLGSGGARAEGRFIWPQEPCCFRYASPPLSITGNCQGSLAQDTTYKLCKTETSFFFSFQMVRFRDLRREQKAQKQTHAHKNLIYDKVASYINGERTDSLIMLRKLTH